MTNSGVKPCSARQKKRENQEQDSCRADARAKTEWWDQERHLTHATCLTSEGPPKFGTSLICTTLQTQNDRMVALVVQRQLNECLKNARN